MQARPVYDPIFQYIVKELGIALAIPNVRGSSGYVFDVLYHSLANVADRYGKQYLLLDNKELREDSVKDIGALIDWVFKQPNFDSSRVGVYGRSYGGYMVLASMIHFGDR